MDPEIAKNVGCRESKRVFADHGGYPHDISASEHNAWLLKIDGLPRAVASLEDGVLVMGPSHTNARQQDRGAIDASASIASVDTPSEQNRDIHGASVFSGE